MYRKRLVRSCSQRQPAKSGASEGASFFLFLVRAARVATAFVNVLKFIYPIDR
jgi:hypothetical protein